MRVAVIGGGFSGSLACIQLLRTSPTAEVIVIERRSRQLNRGVAYSARLSRQLLNVPAGRMGLFPEEVDGFLRWARSGPLPGAKATDLLPRSYFGDFVHDRFHEVADAHNDRLRIVRADATGITYSPSKGYEVRLHNGRSVTADKVLLALGHAPPAHVSGLDTGIIEHPAYVAWPWKHGVLDGIDPRSHLLFVGTGLTMVDVLLSLMDRGHQGPVTVLSRRGLLPRPHGPHASWAARTPSPDPATASVGELMAWISGEVRLAEADGIPWQSVMDMVRGRVQAWWKAMPDAERARFLRHARPFWEIHRHRMPPESHARLAGLQADGRVRIVAAGIERVSDAGGRLEVRMRERGSNSPTSITVERVINCTGPQADSRRMEQPLLRSLLDQGLGAWDALKLGLRCEPSGALVGPDGRVSDGIFALGPLCKAALWECTAVPEIRDQVAALMPVLALDAEREQGFGRSIRRLLNKLTR